MNLVNRMLIVVELLIAIALMPIAIVLVLFFRAGTAASITNLGRGLTEGANVLLIQIICVGVALLVFIISIVLLFLELQRSAGRGLVVPQVTDGKVHVTDDAIVQRLEFKIAQIADIVRVRPRITAGKGNVVDAFIELETSPEVNVPQKTQEVIGVAKQVMEQQMGVQVGTVQVQVSHSRKQTKSQGS